MSFRLHFDKSNRLWDRYPSEFCDLFRMDDRRAAILTPYLPKPGAAAGVILYILVRDYSDTRLVGERRQFDNHCQEMVVLAPS